MDSSGPVGGTEIAILVVAVVFTILLVVGIFWSISRGGKQIAAMVTQLTPDRILVDGFLVAGGGVELRTRAVASGVHKIWLECATQGVSGRWTATANVAHRISTTQTGYRETEAVATREPPISFGEDGDGVSATAAPSTRRSGALSIPKNGMVWLQLMTLPPCPEGAEIYASVAVANLTEPAVRFRAFVGVSER